MRAMTTPERGPQETLRHHGRAGSEHRRGRRAHARPVTGARPCVRQPWVFARGAVAREESVADPKAKPKAKKNKKKKKEGPGDDGH